MEIQFVATVAPQTNHHQPIAADVWDRPHVSLPTSTTADELILSVSQHQASYDNRDGKNTKASILKTTCGKVLPISGTLLS